MCCGLPGRQDLRRRHLIAAVSAAGVNESKLHGLHVDGSAEEKIARFVPAIAATAACEHAECGPTEFMTE